MSYLAIGNTPLFEITFQERDSDGALIALDISDASAIEIHFRRPSGSTFSRDMELTSDGTDGKAEYQATASDLDVAGAWTLEGNVQWAGGRSHHTELWAFRVHPPLIA